MAQYAKGMALIVDSLSGLQDYVTNNGLKGSSEVHNFYDKIKNELDMVKQYVPK